jgi:hypothetical protein
LNLENCKLTDKGGALLINECLPSISGLTYLNLNNNELSTSSGHALSEYFNKTPEVTTLEINYNNFNG